MIESPIRRSTTMEPDISLLYDDERLIEDAITTPYERVLKILNGVKVFIENLKEVKIEELNNEEMVKDLDWVINRIQSHSLYTYELIGDSAEDLEKMSEESPEIKSFLQFLSDFSEAKNFKRTDRHISKTTKVSEKPFKISNGVEFKENPNNSVNDYECDTSTNKGRNFLAKFNEGNLFKIQLIKADEEDQKEIKKGDVNKSQSNIVVVASSEGEENTSKSNGNNQPQTNKLSKSVNSNISVYSSPDVKPGKKEPTSLEGIVKMRRCSNMQTAPIIYMPLNDGNKLGKEANENNKVTFEKTGNGDKQSSSSKNLGDLKGMKLNLSSISNLNINGSRECQTQSMITPHQNIQSSNFLSNNQNISTPIENFEVDVKAIMSKDFDIHEYESKVGRVNVLPVIGKTILKTLGLTELINNKKLDCFLRKVSNGYNEAVQYHNSLHGADVAHTISIYLLNSNLEVITQMTNNDILAMIVAALGHDIGHPGTNNGFHINTYSDIAITYNDQSVLENFHSSCLYRILRQQEFNILDTFPDHTYKILRKRIIGLILATDMSQHAKILSVLKPKVLEYSDIVSKLPQEDSHAPPFVTQSNMMFDDQQRVMDFVIHTADLSHNSKKFKISVRWTDLLMEEFWQQGDTEKKLGVPVSFLCDRTTAEVPKSQIGFIRGIILPTFEVLLDLLPGLNYLRDGIENNLNEWARIAEEQNMLTPKLGKSPRLLLAKTPRHSLRSPRNSNNSGKGNLLGVNLNSHQNVNQFVIKKMDTKDSSVSLDANKIINLKK